MSLKGDDVACVIVARETRKAQWALVTRTLRRSVAFRSAHYTQQQERQALGHRHYETAVITADNYDSNRMVFEKPPAGFEDMLEQIEHEEQQQADKIAAITKVAEAQEVAVEAEFEMPDEDDDLDDIGGNDLDI